MKEFIIAAVFVGLLVVNGEANSQPVRLMGPGAQSSCGSWLADRASNTSSLKGSWALGFLSGVAAFSPQFNPLRGVDSDAVFYWLDNYCRARPTDLFSHALYAFVSEHPK
jgi:hypothetical protein